MGWQRCVRVMLVFILLLSVLLIMRRPFIPQTQENTTLTGWQKSMTPVNKDHHLAVLIPFRERLEDLKIFIPYMHKFLGRKRIKHTFIVINQMDNFRFNRAALINTGFLHSEEICDYIAMHDVDLMPANDELNYRYPKNGPFHLAAPNLHPMYHYELFIGGILLVNNKHFRKVNGMSNDYWGWGREDDEFYWRLQRANLTIAQPANITTGRRDTFKHLHDEKEKPRDKPKLTKQEKLRLQESVKQQHSSGLETLQCSILSKKNANIENISVTVINVKLHCNVTATPGCIEP